MCSSDLFISHMSPNEAAALIGPKGELTAQAINQIRAALFTKVYGQHGDLILRYVSSPSPDLANIGNALERSIPKLGLLESLIEARDITDKYSLAQTLADMDQEHSKLRADDMSVAERLESVSLFDDINQLCELERVTLRMLDSNKTKPRFLTEIIEDYARRTQEIIKTGNTAEYETAAAILRRSIQGDQLSLFELGQQYMPLADDPAWNGPREIVDSFGKYREDPLQQAVNEAGVGRQQYYFKAMNAEEMKPTTVNVRKYRTDLVQRGYINFSEQIVKSPRDVAELFTIYRDPSLETLRVIYIKDNKVISHEAYSSGAINMIKPPQGIEGHSLLIKKRAGELEADGVYLLHNHPSTNPDPSIADVSITRKYAKQLEDIFLGHIVINFEKFAFIDVNGGKKVINFTGTRVDEFAQPNGIGLQYLERIVKSLGGDRKSTRLNSSHIPLSRMPSSA